MVDIFEREQGGPNKSFLKKHVLDKYNHPADWFNALMPLTPKDNLEHLSDVDVKRDGKTKFAILHQLLDPVNEWPKRYKNNGKNESGKRSGHPQQQDKLQGSPQKHCVTQEVCSINVLIVH